MNEREKTKKICNKVKVFENSPFKNKMNSSEKKKLLFAVRFRNLRAQKIYPCITKFPSSSEIQFNKG
jgi:hypothetical protein